jgi:hypothetical protein
MDDRKGDASWESAASCLWRRRAVNGGWSGQRSSGWSAGERLPWSHLNNPGGRFFRLLRNRPALRKRPDSGGGSTIRRRGGRGADQPGDSPRHRFGRHPDRPGRRLDSGRTALVTEWKRVSLGSHVFAC